MGPEGGEPNIFPLPLLLSLFFSLSLGGSSRGILVVFEAPGPSSVNVCGGEGSGGGGGGPAEGGSGGGIEKKIQKSKKSKHLKNRQTMCRHLKK